MDPFTGALVLGGIGALTGMEQARAQRKAQQQQAQISAAQTQYSPWTGIKPQQYTPQPVESGLESGLKGGIAGGLSGYMQGLKMQKAQAPQQNSWAMLDEKYSQKPPTMYG